MVQGMTLIFLFEFPHPLLCCGMAEPVMDISCLGSKAGYSCKIWNVQIGTWTCVCNSHNGNGTHLELILFDFFIIFFPNMPKVLQLIYQAQFHMNFSVYNWVTAHLTWKVVFSCKNDIFFQIWFVPIKTFIYRHHFFP